MGALTGFLQEQFASCCPPGWRCRAEVPLVDKRAARRLGFEPRADVLLERTDQSHKIWIEFEISRADPVANHAKFATARFLEPGSQADTFVSTARRHIAPGRLALAAGTALMMRGLGFSAFQIQLLPQFDGDAIKTMNAASRTELPSVASFAVSTEIDRALSVAEGRDVDGRHRIHRVDNAFTVAANVRQWNAEMSEPTSMGLWGSRQMQYFAFDPVTHLFAPSKFCAFVPTLCPVVAAGVPTSRHENAVGMKMSVYATLEEGDPRFDGHLARVHLQQRLGYRLVRLEGADQDLQQAFRGWHRSVANLISLRAPIGVLLPPSHR